MARDWVPHGGHLDEGSRVVIPAPVRKLLGWGPGTPVVVEWAGPDRVAITRSETHCLFCQVVTADQRLGRPVCDLCAETIARGWLP